MPQTTLYRGSYGLSNRVPPELIPYNAKTGVTGLQRADNLLIGEAGQLYGRQGSRQVISESCHSPYPVPGGFLFAQESDTEAWLSYASEDAIGDLVISKINQLKTGEHWLSWFEDGGGQYWYSTEKERGIISANHVARDWPDAEQYLAKYSDKPVGVLPCGRHVAINGTVVISSLGSEIYKSEPMQPSLYNKESGQFSAAGPVRMLLPVQSGFYYSDDKAIWFVAGLDPKNLTARKVLDYPAIEYCHLHGLVSASDLGLESYSLGVVFMTVQGPVFGFPDGTPINLTDKQFAIPNCNFTRGSMTLVNKSNLIISLFN